MKIQGLEKLLNDSFNQEKKLYEGSIIKAKIMSIEENNGIIKLYDGTIIPAIFLSNDIEEKDAFLKFKIEKIEDNTVTLKLAENTNQNIEFDDIKLISDKLSIPTNKVEEIIKSLMKFNVVANDENIMLVFNTHNILEKIKHLKEDDINNLMYKFFKVELSEKNIQLIKQYISDINDIDIDFISFMLENKIELSLDNIIKTKYLLDENTFVNSIIQKLNHYTNTKTSKIYTLEQIANEIALNKDISNELLKDIHQFIEKLDIMKNINQNYSLYFFNTQIDDKIYKNNIIIKNKYKSKKVVDINNIKFYIKVDTQNLGAVEAYVHKHNNNIIINLKCQSEYITLFKNNIKALESSLKEMRLNLINIHVEEAKNSPQNIINFFNDYIFSELDVKV